MRILVLSSFPPAVGGGELQTLLQTRELARMGNAVTVIDLRPRQEGPSDEWVDGVRVVRILGPATPLIGTLGFHLRLAARVRAASREADVVQINHIGTGLISASAALCLRSVPRVLVVWGSAADGVGPFAPSLRFALARSCARRCHRVVSLATAVVPNLERQGFDPARIRMIPNGVETERYRPRGSGAGEPPPDWPASGPVAISVGRLVPAKSHASLLDAWAAVVRSHPSATLVLVGDGPLRSDLQMRVRVLGLGGRVRFLGTREDVPRLLAAADFYVSSSRTEGMSNAILEAASSGLAVVATRVGGAADIVEDPATGLLVPPEDPAALIRALDAMLRGPEQRARMGEAARARAVREFSIASVVARYLDLYREAARP